jgi:hypothetical protein
VRGLISMQYRLASLLTVLALAPPVLGFACLVAPSSPEAAGTIVLWAAALFAALTWQPLARIRLQGLTVAEWLVIMAILAGAVLLLAPAPNLPHRD